ncbi:MAG: DUF296 domain-containing protein [Candidatus Micrarchaeia archaeon]|jgi:predicted DNA-binding protein with PD1-like motif
MQSRKEKYGYWLVLSQGEEVKFAISEWARKNKVAGAQVWGIGAVTDVALAYYFPQSKKWKTRRFSGKSYELLSCIGNISEDGLHAHVSMSDSSFKVQGGHLLSAKISVFGEFFVLPTAGLAKKLAPKLGLRGIDLKK